jgi:hypothetical protein
MSKADIADKLEQREAKRKQSVVQALIGNKTTESVEGQSDIKQENGKPQKGRPADPNREKKDRKSLALLPSIYEDAAKIAYVDRTSVSEIVSNLLEDYIKQNSAKLSEYDRLKK